jgi:hypothetical protein
MKPYNLDRTQSPILSDEAKLVGFYIKTLREEARGEASHERLMGFVDRMQRITDLPSKDMRKAQNRQLMDDVMDDPEVFLKFTDVQAKIADLAQRGRKIAGANVFQNHLQHAEEQSMELSADSVEYIFKKFSELELSSEKVQEYLNRSGQVTFSLTGHPTNTNSLASTKAAIELERVLSSPDATVDDLSEAMNVYASTPSTRVERKSVQEEVDESLLILDNLWDVSLEQYQRVRGVLNRYGYDDVDIEKPLFKPSIWPAGDGDGNPNATEEELRATFEKLYNHSKNKFTASISSIYADVPEGEAHDALREALNAIAGKLESGAYRHNDDAFAQDTTALVKTAREVGANGALMDDILGLDYRQKTFGVNYTTVDMRHNAVDLTQTLNDILNAVGETPLDDIAEDVRDAHLTRLMQSPDFLEKVAALETSELESEVGQRILGRMRAAGENPGVVDKMIIAEAETTTHALSALLLQKSTGMEVPVVPLFESPEDLRKAGDVAQELLGNEQFQDHIKATDDRVIFMIAKSDTTRRGGPSAQEDQEFAAGKILQAVDNYVKDTGHLVAANIFSGGGYSLQRGGGRTSEVSSIVQSAAVREGVTDGHIMGPTIRTTQGHQQQLDFSGIGDQTLNAHLAQELKTAARWDSPDLRYHVPADSDKEKALEDKGTFFEAMRKAFPEYKDHKNFTDVAQHYPVVSVEAGNDSSRTSLRGAEIAARKVEDILSQYAKLFDMRAITLDRAMARGGYPTMFMGVDEAFDALKTGEGNDAERLNNMYQSSKSVRDFTRARGVISHMIDFDYIWEYTGQERPNDEEVARLASEFDLKSDENSLEATMAYTETYIMDVTKGLYTLATGKEPGDDFTLKTYVDELYPDLGAQMHSRERQAELAHLIEATLTHDMHEHPDRVLDEQSFQVLKNIFIATNVDTNTPEGIVLTNTLERSTEEGKIAKPREYTAAVTNESVIPALRNARTLVD